MLWAISSYHQPSQQVLSSLLYSNLIADKSKESVQYRLMKKSTEPQESWHRWSLWCLVSLFLKKVEEGIGCMMFYFNKQQQSKKKITGPSLTTVGFQELFPPLTWISVNCDKKGESAVYRLTDEQIHCSYLSFEAAGSKKITLPF